MRRLEYFLVSKSVSLDQFTNEMSLFHVTHHLKIPSTQSTFPQLCVVASWIDEDIPYNSFKSPETGKTEVSLEVFSPGGTVNRFKQEIPNLTRFENSFFRVTNIPIPGSGDLIFKLLLSSEHAATHTIAVEKS